MVKIICVKHCAIYSWNITLIKEVTSESTRLRILVNDSYTDKYMIHSNSIYLLNNESHVNMI